MNLPEFSSVSSGLRPAQALGGYPAVPTNSLQCRRLKWDLFGIARSGLPLAEGIRGRKAGVRLGFGDGAVSIDNFPSVELSCKPNYLLER